MYTRVIRGQDGVEVKSRIDLVLMKNEMLSCGQEVRAVRLMGLSDHYFVLHKVGLVGGWIKRREVVVWARRIRSEKLREDL